MSFGTTIPVTGLNLGFAGTVSRLGERVVASRPVLSTAAANISFGSPVVIIPNASGGGDSYQSVADYIAGGGTFSAAKFAGVAMREVKTNLAYVSLGNNGNPIIGSYAPNEMCEALERGSITVPINSGTPSSQAPVYVRTALDSGIPAGVVGGFEAGADPNPVTAATISTTNNSNSATVSSAAGLTVGMIVSSANVPAGTSILTIVGTTITLSANATATAATVAATFTHTLQLTNVVFRTGVLDNNKIAEITLLSRVAA